ncbi:NADH dehydrogenase I, J subunit [Syntrophotalea carbinolica DSM 2380]|uniref:NADH-quinone oxidoreductase subunit J n=1 Tax=Syntrophotalea carbinolica (strain DSM 2380 / NBRC 103641 / GraBd1) TaxID=338963 RepID=Q3A819_SYNC1|nr:NADH-quinone oxidoreductase subunit J [Syntrophotalea carbinolica]ABA87473.1 NADH dehydrogenase I, J subunit [Syntrophotalea carbinolica DSM 2380]
MATLLFYILAVITLLATLLCLTRKNPVHAVLYLVHALFAVALLYFLLGAPLLAAWQVILYAGAIMVLFLFVIMLIDPSLAEKRRPGGWPRWLPAALLSGSLLACGGALIVMDPVATGGIVSFQLTPRAFGRALFENYGLAVEIISLILLFAAVGAFHLGRRHDSTTREDVS